MLKLEEACSTGCDRSQRPRRAARPRPSSNRHRSMAIRGTTRRKSEADPIEPSKRAAPPVEFRFARLMRDYSHPVGDHGVEHRAYLKHALNAWNMLTPAQKQETVQTAAQAPGKGMAGNWLDNGRETGKFEVVEERAVVQRAWVRKDTPQWTAWEDDYGAKVASVDDAVPRRWRTGNGVDVRKRVATGIGIVGACDE